MCFKMPDLIACQLQRTSHPVMMSQAMLKQVFSLCIFIYFLLVDVVVQCAYFLSKKIFAFCIWTPKRTSFSDIYSTLLVHCAYQGVMFELCSTHDEEASNVATNWSRQKNRTLLSVFFFWSLHCWFVSFFKWSNALFVEDVCMARNSNFQDKKLFSHIILNFIWPQTLFILYIQLHDSLSSPHPMYPTL